MSLTIACYSFERHHYDQRGDVLYLSFEGYKGLARESALNAGGA